MSIGIIVVLNRGDFIYEDVRILMFKFMMGLYVINWRFKSVLSSFFEVNLENNCFLLFICKILFEVLFVVKGLVLVVIFWVWIGVFVKFKFLYKDESCIFFWILCYVIIILIVVMIILIKNK